jgi:hypothetical protein
MANYALLMVLFLSNPKKKQTSVYCSVLLQFLTEAYKVIDQVATYEIDQLIIYGGE